MPDGSQPFLSRWRAAFPLHGHLHLFELHRGSGDRAGEDPRGCTLRQGLLHRLRRHHGNRRRDQHGQGGTGRQRGGLRARRDRPECHPGAPAGGRQRIIGVDLNPDKVGLPTKFGMTDFVNPSDGDPVEAILDLTGWRCDYSFECIGNVNTMRQALECCHRGWGESIIIGVAGAGAGNSARRRFSWSPDGSGGAPPSAAPRAAPRCRRSSTGTWMARSTSTI